MASNANPNDTRVQSWEQEIIENIQLLLRGDNLPLTDDGDLLTKDAGALERVALGAEGSFLISDGSLPTWGTDVPRVNEELEAVTITGGSDPIAGDSPKNLLVTTSAGNQTMVLPDGTSLPPGWSVAITNDAASPEDVIVENFASVQQAVIDPGQSITFMLSTDNVTWLQADFSQRDPHNVVTVGKDAGADFSSLADAIASITTASQLNTFVIEIGVGDFFETNPVQLKEWVYLKGVTPDVSKIWPTDNTQAILNVPSNTRVSNLGFLGATGAGGVGVHVDSAVTNIQRCLFANCETLIKYTATTAAPTIAIMDNSTLSGACTTGVHIDGTTATSTGTTIVQSRDNAFFAQSFAQDAVLVEGPLGSLISQGDGMLREGATAANGFHLADDATAFIVAAGVSTFDRGYYVDATGSGGAPTFPTMFLSGCVAVTCATDIEVANASAEGFVNGVFDHTKISIVSGAEVAANFVDTSASPRVDIVGELFYGPEWNRNSDLGTLLAEGTAKGLLTGGALSAGVAADAVDVAAGVGYVIDTSGGISSLHKVEWTSDTLTQATTPALADDSNNYVYADINGDLQVAAARPDDSAVVLLGRAYLANGARVFIDGSPVPIFNGRNIDVEYDRNVFGALFSRGGITTTSALPGSTDLSVTSGLYYFSQNGFSVSGMDSTGGSGPPVVASFSQVNTDGTGTYVYTGGVTAATDTLYDTGTGTAAIPAGEFAKHALYLVGSAGSAGNEAYFLQLSQATYVGLVAAQAANIPTPPSGNVFEEGFVLIAEVIVEDSMGIQDITDARPLPVTAQPVAASTTDHGSLSGLGDDDHMQYLLVSGTRAMTGNLQMGANNIVTSGTVDGVTVSAHASRHLPLGADPLTTAAPTTDLSSSTTNATGSANSLARSDHTHAIDVTSFDHGDLAGLADDDHTQYALLAGRAGGQTLNGGTAASDNLVLSSTSNATLGQIQLHDVVVQDDSDVWMGSSSSPTVLSRLVWDFTSLNPSLGSWKALGVGFGQVNRWQSAGGVTAGDVVHMTAGTGIPQVTPYSGSPSETAPGAAIVGVALTAGANPGDPVDVLADGVTTVVIDGNSGGGTIDRGSLGMLNAVAVAGRVRFNTGGTANQARIGYALEDVTASTGALIMVRLQLSYEVF